MQSDDKVPLEIRLAAANDSIERQRGILAIEKELSTTLNRLRNESLREIHSLIGAEKLERYNAFQSRRRQRIADTSTLLKHVSTSETLKQEVRKRSLAEAREFVAGLDIDLANLKRIQKQYAAQAQLAIEQAMQSEKEAPYVDISSAEVPKLTNNPWRWYYPTYAGAWGTTGWDGSGGSRSVSHAENAATGEIGSWSSMGLHDADDSDYSYTNALSEIWIWFQMPAAGLVEAWVYLQATNTPYGGCLSDEWGFSDASIQQLTRPYLEVINPAGGRRYGTLLDYRRGEDEGCWASFIATGGDYRYAHLYSMESYAAGQWVLMAIGVHDYNYFWVNDMSCDSYLTSRWFVRQIAVRSTGAP